MEPNKDYNQNLNNSESNSENPNSDNENRSANADGGLKNEIEGTEEGYNSSPEDKYLAMEQPGVAYTPDTSEFVNSDQIEDGGAGESPLWDPERKNSRNSEAFNQDEYMLDQNLDLDEETGQSISSDND